MGKLMVDISDISISHCSVRGTARAIDLQGASAKRLRNIALTDILFEETDDFPGPMVNVAHADGVVFRGLRTWKGGGVARPATLNDMSVADAAPEIVP